MKRIISVTLPDDSVKPEFQRAVHMHWHSFARNLMRELGCKVALDEMGTGSELVPTSVYD